MLNRTVSATISTARRRNAPGTLPLSPSSYRRTSTLPQSPLPGKLVLQRSMITSASSSTIFVPLMPQPLTSGRTRERLEGLTRCLGSSVPGSVMYPSFGQVCSEAVQITSFLDLYRKHASDEERLQNVKSPTSRDRHGVWSVLKDVVEPTPARNRTATRHRSCSLTGLADSAHTSESARKLLESGDTVVGTPELSSSTSGFNAAKTGMPVVQLNGDDVEFHGRLRSLKEANKSASAAHTDEKRTGGPRSNQNRVRPRELVLSPLPPPTASIPSPPLPSPLLTVKSPRSSTLYAHGSSYPRRYVALRSPGNKRPSLKSPQAPYWVNSRAPPKTPWTMRSERRQGWGGHWTAGDIGQAVDRLRDD